MNSPMKSVTGANATIGLFMVGVFFCFGMLAVAILSGTLICLVDRFNESANLFRIFLSGPCLDA